VFFVFFSGFSVEPMAGMTGVLPVDNTAGTAVPLKQAKYPLARGCRLSGIIYHCAGMN